MNISPRMNVEVNTTESGVNSPLSSISSVFIPPDSLTPRQIQKLKKKKQNGLLSEDELLYYSELLAVKPRYVLLRERLLQYQSFKAMLILMDCFIFNLQVAL